METAGDSEAANTATLALFLKALGEAGRATVSAQPLDSAADDALAVLEQLDELARAELALDCPRFSPEAALWAARLTYHFCQFTVCRDIDAARVQEACRIPCPAARGPETDWSADLTLRHLPRIHQLAHQLSNADPLVQHLRETAAAWPLSSVGFPRLEIASLESFITHPALCRLYADRILAAGDESRLGDARVADFLRADLGLHHELAPTLARKLFTSTHDSH